VDRRDNNWEVKLEKEHILCSKAVYPDTTTCRQARLFIASSAAGAVNQMPEMAGNAERCQRQRQLSVLRCTPWCTDLQVMKYGPEDVRLLASSLEKKNADHTATIDKVTGAVIMWQGAHAQQAGGCASL
jgi:hypothetical protein